MMMMSFAPSPINNGAGMASMVPVFIPTGASPSNIGPVPTNPTASTPPGGAPGFDYSSLNSLLFQSPVLTSFPQLASVPIQTSYIGPNGQLSNYQVNYAFLPATQPNQITSADQLKTIPSASSGNLASLMTLAGFVGAGNISGMNNEGSILPPALTMPIGFRPGTSAGVINTGAGGFNLGGGTLGGGAGLLG
jgi:hypothetical protein